MFNRLRKGKNLSEIDNWLDSLGYYRKNVAYDETCLFRAVSEQVSYIKRSKHFLKLIKLKGIFYNERNNFYPAIQLPNFP